MRLPPAPVHGADDPWNSADDGAGALFASTRVQNRRREPACLSSGCRPSSSRKALHSMARNLELHQHVWLSSSCERLPAISMARRKTTERSEGGFVPTGMCTWLCTSGSPRHLRRRGHRGVNCAIVVGQLERHLPFVNTCRQIVTYQSPGPSRLAQPPFSAPRQPSPSRQNCSDSGSRSSRFGLPVQRDRDRNRDFFECIDQETLTVWRYFVVARTDLSRFTTQVGSKQ